MAITRKYETKEECVGLFVDENFDAFPSWTVTEQDCWFDRWEFEGIRDSEDLAYDGIDDEEGLYEFGLTHPPMWNTWFIPNWWVRGYVERHVEEVAEMGFTLIYESGHDYSEHFFALGIDGAGYSFRDTHFTRLYDAMGITWHEE